MKINLDIVNILEYEATQSNHPNAKISAAVVYRSKIISIGHNMMKSSPFQKKYGKNKDAIYFHAEINAIHKAIQLGYDKFHKSTLYVVRVKWDGSYKNKLIHGLAKPCGDKNCGCTNAILRYDFKNVIYTLDEIEGFDKHFGIIQK